MNTKMIVNKLIKARGNCTEGMNEMKLVEKFK
jgi:hypothetical protein